MTTLDYSPLTSRVTGKDLREFRDVPGATSPHLTGVTAILSLMAILVIGAVVVGLVGQALVMTFAASGPETLPIAIVFLTVVGVVITLLVIARRAARLRLLRIHRFATANRLTLKVNTAAPGYPGAIFSIGSGRTVTEMLSRDRGPAVDIGDLRYTTGSGKNRTTHNWGFVAIRLDRMLPQMILDAKSNNFLGTNLPVSFSRSQVLSLEGDFDRCFALYCPKEYERDALYVFTPDLMARLVDEAALFDVEIVDDWMLLYSASPFDLADAATLARIFRIVDTVGAKTLDRTQRYADAKVVRGAVAAVHDAPLTARMSANIVAPGGRRLRRGLSVGTIVVAIGLAIYAIVSYLPFFRAL